MSWADLDAYVVRHQAQVAELRALAKEGGVYLRPRFRAPCVWILQPNWKNRLTLTPRLVLTTFSAAREALEVHAVKARAARVAATAAKAEAKKARAKR